MKQVLLVKRLPALLEPYKGEASSGTKRLPPFLRQPRKAKDMCLEDEVETEPQALLLDPTASEDPAFSFFNKGRQGLSGLWSGYRSVLLPCRNRWYRLKGVGFFRDLREHKGYSSYGTYQTISQSELRRFNKILLREGVRPVEEYLGAHVLLHSKDVSSRVGIYRVEGDTRLDELLDTLDLSYPRRKPHALVSAIKEFYAKTGFIIGRLLRLMHRHHQSWSSCNAWSTDSHIGNIVMYPDGARFLGIGLVDFDTSHVFIDKDFCSWFSGIGYKIEQTIIIETIQGEEGTYRKLFEWPWEHELFGREWIVEGFRRGYGKEKGRISNLMPMEPYLEILHHIRAVAKAPSKSARRSSASSMPTDRRSK